MSTLKTKKNIRGKKNEFKAPSHPRHDDYPTKK